MVDKHNSAVSYYPKESKCGHGLYHFIKLLEPSKSASDYLYGHNSNVTTD